MDPSGFVDNFSQGQSNIALLSVGDVKISGDVNFELASVENFPINNTQFQFIDSNMDGRKELNLFPVTDIGNLPYIRFQQSGDTYYTQVENISPASGTNNVNAMIPTPPNGIVNNPFIMSFSESGQQINSPLSIESTAHFGLYNTNGILSLDGSANLASTELLNGQLLIGSSGNAPVAATLTSADGSVIITNGAGSIDLSVTDISGTWHSITLDATSNQIIIHPGGGLGTSITLTATNPAANRTYTIPDAGAAAKFMLTEGTQTINGAQNFNGQVSILNNHGITVGQSAIGFNTNEPLKHYNDFGGLNHWIFADTTQPMIYNNPDFSIFAGATTASYVMTEGAQTINASSAFTQPVQLRNTNALKIQPGGSGNYFNINASNPSVSQTFTLPDVATNADIVVSAGSQALSSKTFTLGGNPLALQSDNTNAKANQIQIQGQTDSTKLLTMGYNTSSNYASINAQHGSGAFTFYDQLMLNQAGGIVSIANSNAYTTFNNSSATQLMVFGSGTGDSSCDVLHVRQNTNTNPKEIWLGYQTAGNYGVIQSVYNNVSWSDTYVSPNGGNLVACNGFKMLNSGLSGYTASSMSAYMESSLSTSFVWGTQTLTGISVKLTRIGRVVHVHVPFMHFTTTQNALVVSSATIPAPFQPVDTTATGVAGIILENTTNLYAARCIIAILDMKIYVEYGNGGSSSISANDLQIDAFTITYSV